MSARHVLASLLFRKTAGVATPAEPLNPTVAASLDRISDNQQLGAGGVHMTADALLNARDNSGRNLAQIVHRAGEASPSQLSEEGVGPQGAALLRVARSSGAPALLGQLLERAGQVPQLAPAVSHAAGKTVERLFPNVTAAKTPQPFGLDRMTPGEARADFAQAAGLPQK